MGVSNASGWGYFQSGRQSLGEIDQLGASLNRAIGCACHYPAFGKNLFECACGVIFPAFVVRAAVLTGDWASISKHHAEGYRPDDVRQVAPSFVSGRISA